MKRKIIQFATSVGIYNAGETAGFDEATAEAYVAKGMAKMIGDPVIDKPSPVKDGGKPSRALKAARKAAQDADDRAEAAEAKVEELETLLDEATAAGGDDPPKDD